MSGRVHIRSYTGRVTFLARLLDAGVIPLVWICILGITGYQWESEYGAALLVSVAIFMMAAESVGLYRSDILGTTAGGVIGVFKTWFIVVFLLLLLTYATKISSIYSRLVVVSWFLLTPVALMAARRVFIALALRHLGRAVKIREAVIIGAGPLGLKVARQINSAPSMGLRLIGFYDNTLEAGTLPLEGSDLPVLGKVGDFSGASQGDNSQIALICLPVDEKREVEKLLEKLADTTISAYVVPDMYMANLLSGQVVEINGIPAFSVFDSPFYGPSGLVKRVEDLLLGSFILTLISIPMIFIGLAIKFTSRGPILFKQRRYGLDGKTIWVWKFRTMTVCEDNPDPKAFQQATKNDSRVTRLGSILRKTSLDELPQFINVLSGAMSVVGPRPHAVAHNEQFRKLIPGYMLRHMVKPGITGWAQVNGWRGETDTLEKMQKRVEYDLYYVQNWSLWLDIKIVIMTTLREFFKVGGGKNAY